MAKKVAKNPDQLALLPESTDRSFDADGRPLIDDLPFVQEEDFVSRRKIKVVDLFAGIGGFHYGIAAAAAQRKMGVKPLLVSEIEPSCQETYRRNHHCDVEGDVNAIPLGDYSGTADIVTAGFPCQPFSNSGLKLGLSDPRGQFYFRIAEIIEHFQSKSFILENVPGIRMNGGGRFPSRLAVEPQMVGQTMKYLEDNLMKLKDYTVRWLEIDSSHLGSPQVRKRVYIIGLHRDFGTQLDLDFPRYVPKCFDDVKEGRRIPSLELSTNQEANLRSFMSAPPSYKDGMRRVGNAYLCDGGNVGQGYHAFGMVPTLTKVWARFLPIYFPHGRERLPKVGVKEFEPNAFYGQGYFRRASVREVMRLQGFPDSFVPHESDRLAYEHAGNAVNAKIIREITAKLLTSIR
jgi:DNA (cytosine-5)-methyltransferase 1